MSDGLSVYLSNAWLNTLAGNSFSLAATYLQLHTGPPGISGTANVSAGSTARVSVTWNTASNGSITISSSPTWTNGGVTETITDVSVWDASPGGNFLRSVQLQSPMYWQNTNTLMLNAFGLSLSPIAG